MTTHYHQHNILSAKVDGPRGNVLVQLMKYTNRDTYEVTTSTDGNESWDTACDETSELEARVIYANQVLAAAGAF